VQLLEVTKEKNVCGRVETSTSVRVLHAWHMCLRLKTLPT
jgi:hypothetical protein